MRSPARTASSRPTWPSGIRYEADLARRRFFEVDPANRLVAAALEADWNERLRDLEEACREREVRAEARDSELSER